MANKINYDEDAFAEFSRLLKQHALKVEEVNKKMKDNYSGINSRGLLQEVVNDGYKNFASTQEFENSTAMAFASHGDNMFAFDRDSAAEIDKMFIPQDFVGNNSMEINQYNASILGKIDGESVNKGEKTEKVNDIDESVVAAEGLKNINDDQTKKQEYDDTSIIGESLLGNIANDQTQKQEYDDSTSIGNKNLKDITGEQSQKEEYDDSSVVQKKGINDISGNVTEEQEYEDRTAVIGNSVLGSIVADEEQKETNFDEDAITVAIENKESSDKKEQEKQEQAALEAGIKKEE